MNVFSGSENRSVSVELDDNNSINLRRERIAAPYVNYIKRFQKENSSPDKNSKKPPYLRTKSKHIWKGIFPDNFKKGYNKIVITIENPYFETIKESFWVLKKVNKKKCFFDQQKIMF